MRLVLGSGMQMDGIRRIGSWVKLLIDIRVRYPSHWMAMQEDLHPERELGPTPSNSQHRSVLPPQPHATEKHGEAVTAGEMDIDLQLTPQHTSESANSDQEGEDSKLSVSRSIINNRALRPD